ncbi:hypothetical protein L7F22_032871 [Adiantum nelumboides]|nr:hypothetical protein [Adiantum nelumboides]
MASAGVQGLPRMPGGDACFERGKVCWPTHSSTCTWAGRRRGIKPTASAITESPVDEFGMRQKRQQEYAKYVQLLSWFMDEPSLACPFGVHRMAREGKRLGKEVGEWFGPSTAAGAIKKLVDDYPEAGLGVSMASDGVVYLNQVKTQAQTNSSGTHRRVGHWDRPVLVLIGIRLGLEGVHPMYHDSIKATFSFPQSVGIAGGRPSSSYYFVGYQGNSLFYLDPHHVRSSIPFRHPPPDLQDDTSWWVQAYSEAELSTYHNDRPRRMPMKSLDPSMLLGFLISDEDSLGDFVNRVKALPRPIFSVLESMPKWMMEDEEGTLHEDEKALESFSESSLDDAGGEVEETLEQEECESGPRPGEGRKTDQSGPLHHSVMSNQTATPRSDSTFEFIESQPMLLQTTPVEMRNHHVFLNNSKDAPMAAAAKDRVPSISRSVTDSDDVGSAWEEVGRGVQCGQVRGVDGKAIKNLGWRRSDVVLITKIFFGYGGKDPNARGLSRKHLIEGTDASLERAGLKNWDVVMAHRHDASVPMVEVVKAFNHLISTGRCHYWGTSEWSVQQIQEAIGIADRLGLDPPLADQAQYNALKRDRVEKEYARCTRTTTTASPFGVPSAVVY